MVQTEQAKLKTLQDKVKKVEQRADVASRQMIQESYSTVAKDWRDIQDGLMMRCSDLNDLVDTWEVRWPHFDDYLDCIQRFRLVNYFNAFFPQLLISKSRVLGVTLTGLEESVHRLEMEGRSRSALEETRRSLQVSLFSFWPAVSRK